MAFTLTTSLIAYNQMKDYIRHMTSLFISFVFFFGISKMFLLYYYSLNCMVIGIATPTSYCWDIKCFHKLKQHLLSTILLIGERHYGISLNLLFHNMSHLVFLWTSYYNFYKIVVTSNSLKTYCPYYGFFRMYFLPENYSNYHMVKNNESLWILVWGTWQ